MMLSANEDLILSILQILSKLRREHHSTSLPMKLLILSDIHGHTEHAEALHRACDGADALIACGDFTTFGNRLEIQQVADALRPKDLPCYFVIGNCDILNVSDDLDGWTHLHGRVLPFNGWLFAGLGGALPCPSRTPTEFPEATYTERLQAIRAASAGQSDRLILVSHQPPFGTAADRLPSGHHVGCRALRAFIDDVQPACCLTGHIHEAASRAPCGKTLVVNPGPFAQGLFTTLDL
jgi:Icc-related predicted phosphoesterase